MTKIEDYTEKAAVSLAAATSATTAQERAFHHRAHCIWRRLLKEAELALDNPEASAKPPVKNR